MTWTVYKVRGCCGMAELYGVNTVQRGETTRDQHKAMVKTLMDRLGDRRRAQSGRLDFGVGVFVDRMNVRAAREKSKSAKLKYLQRYINKHKLGTLRIAKGSVNPNTSNWLVAGTWDINLGNLGAHIDLLRRRGIEARAAERRRVHFNAPNV